MKGKSIAFTNDLFFETDENSTVDFEVKPLKTKVSKKPANIHTDLYTADLPHLSQMKPSNNKPSPETGVNTKKSATVTSNPLPSVPPVNLDTNDLFKTVPQKNKPKAPTTDIPNIDFNFASTTPPVPDDLPPIPTDEPAPKNKKKTKDTDDNPFSFGYFLKAKETPQAPNLDSYQQQLTEMTQRALNAEAQLLETQRALKELKDQDKEETKALVEMMQVVERKLLLETERANKAELMVKELEKKKLDYLMTIKQENYYKG